MMYEKGVATSLKNVGEKFLDFVKLYNDNTLPWEVVDDRLGTFYGATIKFPIQEKEILGGFMSDPNIGYNEYKINTTSDNLLGIYQYDCSSTDEYALSDNRYDSSGKYTSSSNRIFSYGISVIFIKSILNDKNLFMSTVNTNKFDIDKEITSDGYNGYVTFVSNIIDAVVLANYPSGYFGIVQISSINSIYHKLVSLSLKSSVAVERIKSWIDEINSYAVSKSISIQYIIIPHTNDYSDVTNKIIYSDIDTINTYIESSVSSSNYLNCINLFHTNIIDLSFKVPNSSILEYVVESNGKKTNTYNYIYAYMKSLLSEGNPSWIKILKYGSSYTNSGIKLPDYPSKEYTYAYISMQHNDITNTTYSDWLRSTKDNYMSENYDHRNIVYTGRDSDDSNNYTNISIISKYGDTNKENVFKNTGEILFIGTHTGYDKNLWMCEQGGITCQKESKLQEIDDNVISPLKRMYPKYGSMSEVAGSKLPPFPSMGCPSLSISDKNKTDYSSSINYYFVKDNFSANIIIYVESEEMKALEKRLGSTLCQHISFGRLNSFSEEEKFKFPLYVAGGNQNLSQDIWLYVPAYNVWRTHKEGNIYDLDMHSQCMSNSNLLLSAKFNGSNVSNFRVMRPDGRWEDIFNCSQSAVVTSPHLEYGEVQQTWYYPLGGVSHGNATGSTTLNNANNSIKRIDTYSVREKLTDSVRVSSLHDSIEIKSTSPLDPVIACLNSELTDCRYGAVGVVPNCFSTWSRNLGFGEYVIKSKRYLCIPNVWDLRLWEYPSYIGVYAEQGNELVRGFKEDEYNETYNTLYNYMIYDKLLLYIGEVD